LQRLRISRTSQQQADGGDIAFAQQMTSDRHVDVQLLTSYIMMDGRLLLHVCNKNIPMKKKMTKIHLKAALKDA